MRSFLLLVVGLTAVLVLTLLVFGLPVGESLGRIFTGAFASHAGIARTLVTATPIMLTGLGIVVAWRAGAYNIGGEGQFVIGALCGAALARFAPGLPPMLLCAGILLATILGGALYAWLASWLYVKRGVQVVVSTILLNFVAIQLLQWAVTGPLQEPTHELPMTSRLAEGAMLMRLERQTDLHLGVFFAPLAAVLVAVYLYRTKGGFHLRLVGSSPRAARAARIDAPGVQMRAMMLSGALCGLAGGIEYVGMAGRLGSDFAQGWGFLGIPVALLGGLHPLLTIPSSLIFGGLLAGAQHLTRFASSGSTLIYIVQSVAVLAYVGVSAVAERTKAQPRREAA